MYDKNGAGVGAFFVARALPIKSLVATELLCKPTFAPDSLWLVVFQVKNAV